MGMSRSARRSFGNDLLGDMRCGEWSRGTTYGRYGLGDDKGSSVIGIQKMMMTKEDVSRRGVP